MRVVRPGEVGAVVHAARFFAQRRRLDDDPRHGEHVLQFPAVNVLKLPGQHIFAPAVDVLGRFDQRIRARAARPPRATRRF